MNGNKNFYSEITKAKHSYHVTTITVRESSARASSVKAFFDLRTKLASLVAIVPSWRGRRSKVLVCRDTWTTGYALLDKYKRVSRTGRLLRTWLSHRNDNSVRENERVLPEKRHVQLGGMGMPKVHLLPQSSGYTMRHV